MHVCYVASVVLDFLQSNGLSRPLYWSGLLFSPPGDLPDAGIEPRPLMSPALAGFFTTSTTWEGLLSAYSMSHALLHLITAVSNELGTTKIPVWKNLGFEGWCDVCLVTQQSRVKSKHTIRCLWEALTCLFPFGSDSESLPPEPSP